MMYIFSYCTCLTSGSYNKAATTVKGEETLVHYDQGKFWYGVWCALNFQCHFDW